MLDREALLDLLGELAAELDGQGCRGEMFVVGGAAMALAYSTRRSTRDIDAVFEPKVVVYRAAWRLAERRGLDRDWLNDAVKAFLPGDDPGATVLFERPGLVVRVASPRYLLAMKLMAARVERDEDDIGHLFELCGLRRAAEGLDLVEETYPHLVVAPRVQYLLEEMFPDDPA
jgi:hypothetical protein